MIIIGFNLWQLRPGMLSHVSIAASTRKWCSLPPQSALRTACRFYSRPRAFNRNAERADYYPPRILYTRSVPLNFHFQQPLPFKWAAFGLTNSTNYSITCFIHVFKGMLGLVFALNPSCCCCVCVNTHIWGMHTHTHTHTINSNHCQWFGRNQHFSGWTNSRDNITNGESSHTADRPWQVNEPFLLSGLSCKKPELENSIHISKSKVFIFYLKNVSQPIDWHWNKLSLKSFWQKATK